MNSFDEMRTIAQRLMDMYDRLVQESPRNGAILAQLEIMVQINLRICESMEKEENK